MLLTEPYLERAHRLSIAARLVAGGGTGTAVVVKRLEKALADIGVEPEPVTRILLRQAASRSAGAVTAGAKRVDAAGSRPVSESV